MKIGVICQPFDDCTPPVPNGSIALLTWELARRLKASHDVIVCAPLLGQPLARERVEGVWFERVSLGPDRRLLDRPRKLNGPLSESRKDTHSILYCPLYALRCAARLRAAGCQLIHIHNFSQFVPIARLLNPRAKIVLHMNCDWLNQFESRLIDRRLRHADAIIGCAQFITDHVKLRFRHAERCVTVYNGANIFEFGNRSGLLTTQDDRKRFIFIGRVSPEKGVHVLIEAFKGLLRYHPDATLNIVGGVHIPPLSFIVEPSDNPSVKNLARFYNIDYLKYLRQQLNDIPEYCIRFNGFVEHSQLAALLHQADVFVQPSIWGEPFPLSVIEAMAAGLPVVSSSVGGLPESVIDGETGLLVEPDNSEALANAMLTLIANRELAQRMGDVGAARAKGRFSWESVIVSLNSLYRALALGEAIKDLSGLSAEGSSTVSAQRTINGLPA